MLKHQKTSQGTKAIQDLAQSLQCTSKTAMRHLLAAAEQCARGQAANFQAVSTYISSLVSAEVMSPVCLIEFQSYDESPLRLRIAFDREDGTGKSQLGKIFVAAGQWAMVVRTNEASGQPLHTDGQDKTPSYMIFHGQWSPALRAADSTNSHAISQVLATCPRPDEASCKILKWPLRIRVAECDSAPANLKSERLQSQARPEVMPMQLLCAAHKLHAVAEKTWSLDKLTWSGITRLLLCLQGSDSMLLLQTAMLKGP